MNYEGANCLDNALEKYETPLDFETVAASKSEPLEKLYKKIV